jgi:putative membrane protein
MRIVGASIFKFKPPKIGRGWSRTDILASYRTILANERTVLSYVRTALTMFVAGVTFVHFFDSTIVRIVGWALIPIGIVTLIIGIYRYNRESYHIHLLSHRKTESEKAKFMDNFEGNDVY